MNGRFTPNLNSDQEDIIGDVIMGRDVNNFISSRLNQQQQRQIPNEQINYQETTPHVSTGYPHGVGNPSIDNYNYVQSIANQQPILPVEEIQTKVIKIRFEIDFQINLQVNNK